ncbi:MAG: hypothetical protein AVO35_12915 [Candidatus Aegiribacteria sp. MLS_C]|nr:MAG: hypothetical protein AVO35_12915 [Candidatus Aegiribacteria sp. MLS_C]
MRKLFLKVYLPLALCVVMTLVIFVVAMFRIIPAQISSHRESVESLREQLVGSEGISRDSVLALAESLDLEVIVTAREAPPPIGPPPEGYYSLPGMPWNFPFRVDISGGARGGPAGLVRQSFWIILLFLLVTEGLVLFLALWPVRKRLSRLEWAASQLASGKLDTRLETREGGDLIDSLGRTFNSMAEEIKSLVDSHQELLGIVAHELRTPMTRLRLALEIMKEDTGNEHSSKMNRMEQDLVALDGLVTELLDYNRLRRSGDVESVPVDLGDLCDGIVRTESWARDEVDIRLTGGGMCTGDPAMLARALGNLVRNAVRFAESKVLLEVSSDAVAGNAMVRVSDDGPGFDPGIVDKLGEPFVKGRSSKGTGLGLAIALRIAEIHGGSISFATGGLGGAEAVLRLPRGNV